MKYLFIPLITILLSSAAYSQTKITARESSQHIGDSVLVVDTIYGGRLLSNGMTLLNVGGEFPNHLLVLMIKAEDRTRFTYKPEEKLKGKQVKVTGKIIDYKGKPQIILFDPKQIEEMGSNLENQ